VRPIAELNILPKYIMIRIFINHLISKIRPQMVPNQFAFKGKGTDMAIIDFLDEAYYQESIKNNKILIVLWDFSNAYCTILHDIIIKVAMRFGVKGDMLNLLYEYLKQTRSIIKMSDVNGHYQSQIIDTKRGCQQGQIGSDFIFSMVNDQILPEPIDNEFIHRSKYVDDFADIIASKSYKNLSESLEYNCKLLKNQSTSVGLKLNADKTQVMAINLSDDEIKGLNYDITNKPKYLGYGIGLKFSKKKWKLTGNPGADSFINELNAAVRTVSSMRKSIKSLFLRVDAATKILWSLSNSIGLIYVYADDTKWKSVCIAMRKVIKAAGISKRAHAEDIYRISTKLTPQQMAKKQIIVYSLKKVNVSKIRDNRNYSFYDPENNKRPFIEQFQKIFKLLGKDIRKKIVTFYMDNDDSNHNFDKIKRTLKNHFLDLNDPYKQYNESKIREIIYKNRYIPFIKTKILDISVENNNKIFEVSTEKSTLGIRTQNMHRKTLHKI
jgi:hypothetical protein